MTTRTTQCGLLTVLLGFWAIGIAGQALADDPPKPEKKAAPTTQPAPDTQEALKMLMELKEQYEREQAEKAKQRAEKGESAEEEDAGGAKIKPPSRTGRGAARGRTLEELRKRARASTQRSPEEDAKPSDDEAKRKGMTEPDTPSGDFFGPPEHMAGKAGAKRPYVQGQEKAADLPDEGAVDDADEVTSSTDVEPEAEPEPVRRRNRDRSQEEGYWFNARGMAWEDVIMEFVDWIGKPLLQQEDLIIGGTLTYVSDRAFSKEEAIDELNLIMHEKGYRFVELENHIRIVPINEMPMHVPLDDVYPSVKAFEEDDPRDMDYVTVYYQVADQKAQKYVDMFGTALPDYSRLEALDESNQIKLTALARDVRKFLRLKEMIDISPSDPRELKFFEIKTNAREIERMVREFLNLSSAGGQVRMVRDPRTRRMVPRRTGGSKSAGSDVQMVADERTNSLIVKATKDKMTEIEQLITEFDKKPDIGEFTTKIVPVKHGDATEIANLLNQIFQQEQGGGRTPSWQVRRNLRRPTRRTTRGRRTRQPTRRTSRANTGGAPEEIMVEGIFERAKKTIRLVAEPRQNVLIVYANEEGHSRVRELLADIDQPEPDNLRLFELEHADVADVSPLLSQLVSGITAATPRSGKTGPNVVPDESKNAFYVMAEEGPMQKIASLIEQLDVPPVEQEKHVVHLENLQPSRAAQIVETLLSSGGGSARISRPRYRGRRSRRSRSVSPTAGKDYQIIPLDDAQILIVICSADDWAKVEETLTLWDNNALTSTPELKTIPITKANASEIAGKLGQMYRSYSHPTLGRSQVHIESDGENLLVYGVKPAIEEIEGLVEALDVEGATSKVEILPLSHADATQVAQQLQGVLGIGGRRRGRTDGPMIQADPVTNSLIVQASKAELEKIMDFAQRQDEQVRSQLPEQKFFTLRYAQPREVAGAVQSLFGRGGGRGRRGAPAASQIKAVASGPQVIIEAPADKMTEIEAFIKQLDDPQGQEIVIKTIKLPGVDVAQIARKLSSSFRKRKNVTAIFDPDPSSETIVLTVNKSALEEAQTLIQELAEAYAPMVSTVEFVTLTRAPANEASQWLREQLITYISKQYGRSAAQQIKVSAQSSTNRVIINGPQVAVEHGKKLLEQFDEDVETGFVSPITTEKWDLPGLDVRSLARSLDRTFRQEARQRPDRLSASFEADELTQTLIVSAPQDMFERITKLIEEYKAQAADFTPEQKFIAISEADANYIAGQLRQMLPPMISKQYGRRAAQEIQISVDSRLNRIAVTAPKFALEAAQSLIAELDQPPIEQSELRTIALDNADANTVNNILRNIFNEKIRSKTLQVSVEPLTNSLIVGGNDEDFAQIEKWAKELDEQSVAKQGKLEIIDILNASPWEIRNILNAQYGGGGWGRRRKLGQEYSFQVVGGRYLVAQAPEDKMAEIKDLVQRLDQSGGNVEVRTYELPGIGRGIHALAREVTRAMNQTIEQRERRVSINAYEEADTLIVTAREDQFEQIEDFVDKFRGIIEKETTVTRFIELQHLDAARHARTIQDMLANKIAKQGGRSRYTQNLSITPDPRTNRLICYVPEKIVSDLEEVVEFLDVEPTIKEGELRTIELAHADANSVSQTLRSMFEQQRNRRRRDDFSQIEVRIQPEPITNSILVTASDEDFEQIQKMAIEIDEKSILQGNEPQVVKLEFAMPNEVANLVNQWFGGGRGRRGRNQAQEAKASVVNGVLVVSAPKQQYDEIMEMIHEIDQPDPSGVQVKTYDLTVLNAAQVQMAVQGFLRDIARNTRPGQLKPGAFAEPTTNTLVVMAPAEHLPFIDKLIADLEGKGAKQGAAKSYVLTNARADQVARNVDAMLKAKVTEREGVRRSSVQTAVFADPASNRLFVYAPEEYQKLAGDLITMVDAEVDTGEIIHIVPLESANAEQVAQSLTQVLGGGRGGRGGVAERVRITADASSNSILIGGLAKDVAEVEQWITELEENSGERIPEMQIFQLEYATTTEVMDALEGIFGSSGGGRRGRGQSPAEQVTITADDYYGRLVVTANRRKMRQVEKFIEQLDQGPDEAEDTLLEGGRQLYFVDINRGNASDIVWDVSGLLPPPDRGGPIIESDWFGEYVIVKCRPKEFPKIEDLIRQFERRYKVEIVQRVYKPKGDADPLIQHLMLTRAEDVRINQPSKKASRDSLVVELWDEGEEPPQVRERREREEERREREAEKEEDRSGTGGRRVVPREEPGMSLSDDLLYQLEDEIYGPGRLPDRAVARADARGTFQLAAYADGEDKKPASKTRPADTAENSATMTAGDESGSYQEMLPRDMNGEEAAESPVEKIPTRISVQPDGTILLQGPRTDVDDITSIFDLYTEDRSVGEVIRIFKFRYGDVSAAAEMLNIMFNERRAIIPQPQPRRRGGDQRQQGRDDDDGRRGNMMDQFQRMVGGRQSRGQRDTGQRLRIATDPGHNYLIVKCDEADLPEIRQLLRELDIPPGEVQVKIIQLKNLTAEETAQNIMDVLGISKAQQRRGRTATPRSRGRGGSRQQQLMEMLQAQLVSVPGIEGGAKVERVEIVPNAVTNSLLISSPPEVMGLIQRVIDELEGLENRSVIGIHHYELEHARLEDVLPLLQDVFDATGGSGGGRPRGRGRGAASGLPGAMGTVTLSGDPRTNTIIYTAENKDVEIVEAQIRNLDIAGMTAEAETYVCQWGDATAIAEVVSAIYGDAASGGRPRGRGRQPAGDGGIGEVRIVAEAATNTIIVWGSLEKRELIFGKIQELDELNQRAIRELDVVYADPEELAEKLMGIFGDGSAQPTRGRGRRGRGSRSAIQSGGRIMILGDKDAKKLLIRAPDEIYTQIEEVVMTLDQPDEGMQLRRFQLQYADATAVVDSVRNGLAEYMQVAQAQGDDADFDAFTAMPDTRTNSVVVVGSQQTFLFVQEILGTIDVPTPEDQKKDFRIFPLERADASTVADAINSFAAGSGAQMTGGRGRRGRGAASAGGARELDVYAVPEEASNSVMVFGRLDDIEVVEAMVINNLEDSIAGRFEIAEIPVQNVVPSEIVSFIYQFLDQSAVQTSGGRGGRGRGRARGGQGETSGPQIVPNDSRKTLIVRGTPREVEEVRELVQRFDDPEIVQNNVQIIEIPLGQDAVSLAGEIQQIINESEEAQADRTGRAPRMVTVGANEYTNTLLVAGEPSMFGMVKAIVDQLGSVREDDVVTRVIEFKTLSADEAEQIINELQQDRSGSGTRRRSPSRRGSSRRRGGRRGSVMPQDARMLGIENPSLAPAAYVEPYIGVGPYQGLIAVALLGDEDDPDSDKPVRRGISRAFGGDAMAAADDKPRTADAAEPPKADAKKSTRASKLLDTLTGVTGSLRGDVTAKAVDSQRLIITGDESDVAFIEQILLMMESSASPGLVEVFPLQNAKATQLAPIIEDAIAKKIEIRTDSPGPADRFSISAEGRSNSLIVSASDKMMDEIAVLVDQLDVPIDEAMGTTFRAIGLDHIRASEAVAILRPTIQKLNEQREVPKESQASISAIERSNSVMIVGTQRDVEEIERLVKTVDVELTAEEQADSFLTADVVLLPLKNAQAEEVAQVLTDMIEEQQDAALKSDPEKPGEPFVKLLRLRLADGRELPELNLDRPIKVIAEKGTNSLIIFSTPENNEALMEIVGVFDTLPLGADTDVKVFALKYAAAEDIAQLVTDLFDDKSYLNRPSEGDGGGLQKGVLPPVPPGVAAKGLPFPIVVQHDARSNTVIVVGREDAVVLAGGLISELDQPTVDLGLKAHVLELRETQATAIAEKLEELLDERAQALGADSNEARDSAIIKPEERSNSLIVLANEDTYTMIEDLVLQLDSARRYSVVDVVHRPLKFADANKMQGILDEIFQAKVDAEEKTNNELTDTLSILADTRNNALMLTGTRDYLAEAEEIITELDKEGDATTVVRAIKVKLNSAANVASLLKEMVDEALAEQESNLKGTPIHISSDPVSDTLLIAAAREDMTLIERWVEILDRPSEIGRMTLIIPLQRAVADEVSSAVQDIFKSGGSQSNGQVDVTVTSDEMTNSVVAFGPPALLKDIEDFVRRLDGTEGAGTMVRIFKLEQADAEDAGDLITRILEGSGGSVGGGGRSGGARQDAAHQMMLIYQREHPELGTETLKAIRSDVVVISDIRTNSLVITAPPESMPLMESLVTAVDVPPDAAKIRVFRLRNADAEQMVETLQSLFERENATRTGSGGGGGDDSERILSLADSAAGGRQEIAFTTDIRTNSVIAAGTPGYLDLVEEFVLEIDTIPIEDRETFVYAPRNITAEELAASIRDFSEEEQSRLDEIGDDVSIARRQERKIVAISNEESNRIIFDVDPRFRTAVMDVVQQLDQPPPQVLIQVLIIEVTMDNELDLGVEFAFQDLQYSKAGPNDTTTFDYVGGTDLGAAGSGLGGFTFTITGADFNFLFRTLQNEGNLQVLSRPQIVAQDNQEAYIDISDDVPYVTGTQTTSAGQISTSVARERIGIRLEVTPQINPDGFVRMELKQEVSDFTGSTVDVGQGVTAPTFFRREAQTTITVKDNETVVIGGLITSRKENREQKVPILGDIPLLGTLLRNQNDTARRTELLVVLTPHVIRTMDDFRDVSIVERDRMADMPGDPISNPLMQGLRVKPEDLERIRNKAAIEASNVPTPSQDSDEDDAPSDEVYGPVRPALRPDDESDDPDSYDVPLTFRS